MAVYPAASQSHHHLGILSVSIGLPADPFELSTWWQGFVGAKQAIFRHRARSRDCFRCQRNLVLHICLKLVRQVISVSHKVYQVLYMHSIPSKLLQWLTNYLRP